MNPIWLEYYPPGVPAEASILRFASLWDTLEQNCERFRAPPACTNMGVSLSYVEFDRLSRDFGAWLQHEAGLRRGERVAIMLPNLLQYPVALFGALRAGMVVVKQGGNDVLITNPRDIPGFIKVLRKIRFTIMCSVNTRYKKTVRCQEIRRRDRHAGPLHPGGYPRRGGEPAAAGRGG